MLGSDATTDAQTALQKAQASLAAGGGGSAATYTPTPTTGHYYGFSLNDQSDPNTWVLNLGTTSYASMMREGGDSPIAGLTGGKQHLTTLLEAQNSWYSKTPQEMGAWAQKLYAAGYIDNPKDLMAAQDQWNKMTALAANHTHFGNQAYTPDDMVDLYIGANADKLKARAPGGLTHTYRSTNLSDKLQVMALANDALQRRLGRDATPAEVSTFFNTIVAQEKAHPTVNTVTQDAQGNQTSTTTGGFGEAEIQQLLDNQAKANPEFAAKQGATAYFNAAMGALQAIGGSGA